MRNTTERFVHKLSEGDASMRDLLVSKRFGDGNNHLPILVRSGAQISTPDMMNTTLNLGLNEEAVRAHIIKTGNPRRDWDSYRRFIPLYGSAVMGVPGKISERKAEQHVRRSTAPEDIEGMPHAERVLTSLGGMVGHTAAAAAKGIGRCYVSGLSDLGLMDEDGCRLSNQNIREGNWIFLDGETGKVYAGKLPTRPSYEIGPFARVMSWADRFRHMEAKANADPPEDFRRSQEPGDERVGLCRTGHIFSQGERGGDPSSIEFCGNWPRLCTLLNLPVAGNKTGCGPGQSAGMRSRQVKEQP